MVLVPYLKFCSIYWTEDRKLLVYVFGVGSSCVCDRVRKLWMSGIEYRSGIVCKRHKVSIRSTEDQQLFALLKEYFPLFPHNFDIHIYTA